MNMMVMFIVIIITVQDLLKNVMDVKRLFSSNLSSFLEMDRINIGILNAT